MNTSQSKFVRFSLPRFVVGKIPSFAKFLVFYLAVLIFLGGSSGCATFRGMSLRNRFDFQTTGPKPRWAADPQVEEVVDHLNRNAEKLNGWRANNIRIRANNIPLLQGQLAVEQKKRLRLVVTSGMGAEVDMGSNDEQFWLWARRMPPPEYICCSHEKLDDVRQTMGVPFEPEWLMQVLGIEPLDTKGMRLIVERSGKFGRLEQTIYSAHGHPLQKVVLVDLRRGVVLKHSVLDAHGREIAMAKLDDHQWDKASGVVLPRTLKLDWPTNDVSLVMNLGIVDINPASIPDQIWQMPQMKGYQIVDLGNSIAPGTRIASTDQNDRSGSISEPLHSRAPSDRGPAGKISFFDEESDEGERQVSVNGSDRLDEPPGTAQLSFDDSSDETIDTNDENSDNVSSESVDSDADDNADEIEFIERASRKGRASITPESQLRRRTVPREWWSE